MCQAHRGRGPFCWGWVCVKCWQRVKRLSDLPKTRGKLGSLNVACVSFGARFCFKCDGDVPQIPNIQYWAARIPMKPGSSLTFKRSKCLGDNNHSKFVGEFFELHLRRRFVSSCICFYIFFFFKIDTQHKRVWKETPFTNHHVHSSNPFVKIAMWIFVHAHHIAVIAVLTQGTPLSQPPPLLCWHGGGDEQCDTVRSRWSHSTSRLSQSVASLVSDGASRYSFKWMARLNPYESQKKQRYLDSPDVYGIFTYSYIYHKIQVNVG